jgi:hypothetical protein
MSKSFLQIVQARKAYQPMVRMNYLQVLIASFKVIIHQKMIEKTRFIGLVKLSLSIFQSFLDLLLCFCAPV